MKKYIGILKFDNDTKIPAKVKAKDRTDALFKYDILIMVNEMKIIYLI